MSIETEKTNKAALVTGGSKGYGAGIAKVLAAVGYRVFITGRDQNTLEATAKRLGVTAVQADVTCGADWDRVISVIEESSCELELLVNNAGGAVKIAPTDEQTDESINQSIQVNLTGAIMGCRRAVPVLVEAGGGTIVNISSICSRHAWAGWGVYSAAKAGLEQFSKALYLENRTKGVRVTCIIPSWGATDFSGSANLPGHDAETLGQCIKPEELGKLVLDVAQLPSHLCMQDCILWPMVQEVNPL